MQVALRIAAGLVGSALVTLTLLNAIKTFVLPRSAPSRLLALIFHGVRRVLGVFAGRNASYATRDRVMSWHAPVSLLLVPVAWVVLLIAGYALLYVAGGVSSPADAVVISGSSLTTLGFEKPEPFWLQVLAITQGTLGLGIIALVISYLPSMYGAFQRREAAIALLETRAGAPSDPIELLIRFHRIGWLPYLGQLWRNWEDWFADVQESHSSLAPLVFFRSPRPESSWVAAAGAIADAAAFHAAALDVEHDARADLCVRSAYLSLRHIADYFGIPYDPDPAPDDPISVTRAEFDDAYDQLAAEGVPLKPDRDQAWRDWAGWRVNYDAALIALAGLTMTPESRWCGDRAQHAPAQLWQRGAFRH